MQAKPPPQGAGGLTGADAAIVSARKAASNYHIR
jgi:hypothetical protein